MAKASGIKLCPLDEGEAVDIPSAKTTIGRGSFLQVADKRVSRNHATLEVNDGGKLVVVPIHTNPCFFKARGNGQQVILPKDKPRILEHGDVLSLLPDKLFFKVVYSDQKDMEEEGDENEQDRLKGTDSLDDSQEEKPKTIIGDGKEMALPVKKKRILPSWMKGAARRTGLGQTGTKTTHGAKQETSRTQVSKTPNKATRPVQPVSKTKSPKKIKKSESDEDDWDEEKSPVKKSSRKRTSKRSRYRDDDDDEDEDDDEVLPRRRPRAASLKKPKYTDDDFVISDEELDLEHMSSDAESVRGRRGRDEDSDFVLDEEDSGSDWESSSRKPKPKVKGGRTVSHKARGSVRGKRKRGHDSDSVSDEDSDGYVPRPSKRRAAVAATSRMKASKARDEDDDDDDSEKSDEDNRKPANKKAKLAPNEVRQKKSNRGLIDDDDNDDDSSSVGRKKAGTGKQKVVSNDEDMEIDEPNSKKSGKKKPCQYGNECYRKNPKHFEEFSHPQNSQEGDSSGSEKKGREVVGRQKRAAALKQQEKLAALHANSDDDDEDEEEDDSRDPKENLQQHSAPDEDSLNGDDNVSADSDSDFDPDDEESPSRSKAAKRAPQNKPKQKASV